MERLLGSCPACMACTQLHKANGDVLPDNDGVLFAPRAVQASQSCSVSRHYHVLLTRFNLRRPYPTCNCTDRTLGVGAAQRHDSMTNRKRALAGGRIHVVVNHHDAHAAVVLAAAPRAPAHLRMRRHSLIRQSNLLPLAAEHRVVSEQHGESRNALLAEQQAPFPARMCLPHGAASTHVESHSARLFGGNKDALGPNGTYGVPCCML